MEDARRRKAQGKAVETAMARRLVRIARRLMKTHFIYLPDQLRKDGDETDHARRAGYILESWPAFLCKWKRLGVANEAFAKDSPLGIWRNTAQEIYEINLPL